ncbi:xanthine dehydrogenase accessory protein XdhC [Sedimentitalea nanhaiensis]|uniref:Xanthine dehydrogenase accessory factor n=1 Tax=Sedimentitalea nanhaiensis TaxID=999627 RepID=A0A1I6Z4Q3_9RHOB|nr:xanthine dehydrogenase accessory protein XdhC [Sedimentitalea nanhaiensis]SFT57710.1 xanthine dehydrogenase accessory factor [Sedimentitalea nanhaiensis]
MLSEFFARHDRVVRMVLTRVRGSSPRNVGTEMFVAPTGQWGTLGGGQLEYRAIQRAREMFDNCEVSAALDIPLGPEIGQCCGGRVELALNRMGHGDKREAISRATARRDAQPHVYIMGAGHVGRALAELLQHLPVRTIIVDPRKEELALCRSAVETRLTPIPEFEVDRAPPGSAFVVLTHDHALDFLVTSAALARKDAAYVGMIGSVTKRAKFRNWCRTQCDGLSIDTLICPIGASGSRDKRPGVIAAFVAAEVIAKLTSETAATTPQGNKDRSGRGRQQNAEIRQTRI